jgi:hypothetical protein
VRVLADPDTVVMWAYFQAWGTRPQASGLGCWALLMSELFKSDKFQLARFVLRLTFVIVTSVGIAISALLVALAFALERLYVVQALPWAFATLALPACGLVALALSTPLARFVARSDGRGFSGTAATDSSATTGKPS